MTTDTSREAVQALIAARSRTSGSRKPHALSKRGLLMPDPTDCVVKRHGDVIDGPMGAWEARDRAIELNERFQTDEYRVEEFDA